MCFIKIQVGLTFLLPAYQGCPEKEALKRVSLCLSDCSSLSPRNSGKVNQLRQYLVEVEVTGVDWSYGCYKVWVISLA